ncbi:MULTISPECIES: carbohydrate ABC transporter permease [unclassified Rathayibacter]|uniref:carbohydrate ABC transporter permease n=1 Tax=unclassified Rathayibacter TaxID=2609250 RepID=UPI000B0CBDA7|nr:MULTISPECIES: sugar ABC transporter permease [unclassified Rathayibacter]
MASPVSTPMRPVPLARRRARVRWKDTRDGVLMSAPAVLGLLAFVAVPFVAAIVLSLYNVQVEQSRPAKFWGLTNYVRLFTDPVISGPFLRSLVNNLVFAIVVIPVQTGLALLLAVLLNRKLAGVRFFRTFFFMPVVFPMALVAVIWRLILDRSSDGLLNSSVTFLTGGLVPAHDWLGSSATALGSVILLSIWQGVGFQMVILLAALQEIPEERYEAARLDRASGWQQFVHVTVPGIRNTLIFVTLLTTILAFRVYDQVFILIRTAGANEEGTQTLLYNATQAIYGESNLGRASAISVVLFLIIVVITLIQRRVLRQGSES